MTAPALSLQSAMRAALVADTIIVAQVPASRIYDRHSRPEIFPCIVMGEAHEVADDLTLDRTYYRVYPSVHVWTKEPSLEQVKAIAHQVRKVLVSNPGVKINVIDFRFNDCRWLRDPSGEHSHAVLTFEALYRDDVMD